MKSPDAAKRLSRKKDRGELSAPSRSTQYIQERAAVRHLLDATVRVEFLRTCRDAEAREQPRLARTRDVSTSGIGFYYPEVMYRGERLRLTLMADGQVLRVVEATVVWCRRAGEGRFAVGAAFETDPPHPRRS